ncbi:hypothetical protein [Streptomyces sp. YPW6]|uniref:hypothetical protein n=1 Tax=Streptomyces sp. YPW6 TaxID=2840373 RepID=UPI003EB8F936
MIPSTTPYDARYSQTGLRGTYFTTRPVIAWDSNGTAQVADLKTGRLRDADSWTNFAGLALADAPVVAALPGGTWRASYTDDEGKETTWPVLAWIVRADGTCDPITSDRDGVISDATEPGNFQLLFQPEEDQP